MRIGSTTMTALAYSHIQAAQPHVTDAHASAGLAWLSEMSAASKWHLSAEEVCDLLGGMPVRTYHDYKRKALDGQPINLSRDTLERLSLLLGISKGLQIIAPENRQDLACAWFNQANLNPLFAGLSIKEYLLARKTIEALYTVRRYLDAARG